MHIHAIREIKNIKRLCLPFFLSALCLGSGAQTRIRGKAPGRSGHYALLYAYTDLITFTPQRIDSGLVSDDGSFEISCTADSTFYGFLLIGEANFLLYVAPGNEYEVQFPEPLLDVKDAGESVRGPELISEKPGKLNELISAFNAEYNAFLQQNYTLILNKKAGAVTDTFVARNRKKYSGKGSAYFTDFVDYSCAGLLQSTFRDARWLRETYIHKKPVKYLNTAYMNFIHNFYGKTLLNRFNGNDEQAAKLKAAINDNHSMKQALSMMGFDEANEQLRELVMLIGLYSNYGNPELKTQSIQMMLNHAAKHSAYPENRKIAHNMLYKLTRLNTGSPAPGFSLYDIDSNLVKLEDLQGKFVYLDFWATWCKPCMSEMKLMPELHEQFNEHFTIVSISLDRNVDKWREFVHKHPEYKWLFLHYGNNINLQQKYNIKGIPMYYVIDPDGKFMLSPAPRPSENIGDVMRKISMKLEPRKRWR